MPPASREVEQGDRRAIGLAVGNAAPPAAISLNAKPIPDRAKRGSRRRSSTAPIDPAGLWLLRVAEQGAGAKEPIGKAVANESPVHTAVRAQPRHDLLPDVAPLGRRDRGLHADLVGQVGFVHVLAEARPSGFDARISAASSTEPRTEIREKPSRLLLKALEQELAESSLSRANAPGSDEVREAASKRPRRSNSRTDPRPRRISGNGKSGQVQPRRRARGRHPEAQASGGGQTRRVENFPFGLRPAAGGSLSRRGRSPAERHLRNRAVPRSNPERRLAKPWPAPVRFRGGGTAAGGKTRELLCG